MKDLREFTRQDWYGLLGAECAPDGRLPLIATVFVPDWPIELERSPEGMTDDGIQWIIDSGYEMVAVADRTGISVMCCDTWVGYSVDSYDHAIDIAVALPDTVYLADLLAVGWTWCE